mmetsp:Transcript_32017/g.77784  ORF Transcript_32017/g.77784 Transcript_32017/m.77784 type:complete len:146 (-) Transcript_32017:553-990(-)
MFLFAIDALTSCCMKRNVILEIVAGSSKKQQILLKPDDLLKAVPSVVTVPTSNDSESEDLSRAETTPESAEELPEEIAIVPTNDSVLIQAEPTTPEPAEKTPFEVGLSPEEKTRREDEYAARILRQRLSMKESERSSTINQLCHL